MKTREIACQHYKCHGSCALGKDADFYGHCQTCKTYSAQKGGKPARVDLRQKKNDKFMKDKRNWD